MPNSLSQRIILSCILPLILIGGLYLSYTFYTSSKSVPDEIASVGNIISAALMDSGAQALVSRQQDFISKKAVASILDRKDIAAIEWLTLERKRFVLMTDKQTTGLTSYSAAEYEIYYTPVTGVDTFNDDLQLDDLDSEETLPPEPELTGYIKIYFDENYLRVIAYQTLFFKLGVMLLILLVTITATIFSALHLSGTLKRVFSFINQLDKGDYNGSLQEQGSGELDGLSRRLNQLAATLSQNQDDIKAERQRLNSAIVEQTKLRNEADKANDWLKQMLGVLSHEMRTPLNAVVGPIDMVIDKAANPFMVRRLENALSHINDMLAQLDNLMDYTQLEYGQYTLHPSPTHLRDTIERVVSNYRPVAEQKGLQLSSLYNGELSLIDSFYMIDGQRLTQILINLISNAIKFSHTGVITVSWSLTALTQSTVMVTVNVKDQGIGISPDLSKDIFEMFHQADSDVSRRYGGLGIGLGLSKKYADLFGGQLTMSSQKNQGSIFTLRFNVEKSSLISNNEPPVLAENYHFEKSINVLIVEDNIENCNVLCQLLQRLAPHIRLSTERDGETCLARLQNGDFNADIALVDIHLPNVSGLEIIRSIRHHYPATKIVAVTADTSYRNQDACFEAGAELFIKKPVRLNDIARVFEMFEKHY